MQVRVGHEGERGACGSESGEETNAISEVFRVVSLPLRVIQFCFLRYCIMSPPQANPRGGSQRDHGQAPIEINLLQLNVMRESRIVNKGHNWIYPEVIESQAEPSCLPEPLKRVKNTCIFLN